MARSENGRLCEPPPLGSLARGDVARMASELSLRDFAQALGALAEWGARLEPTGGRPAPAGSKLGGLPDLPASARWPAAAGLDSVFVAQIAVSDLPPVVRRAAPELERRRLLSFFAFRAPTLEVVGGRVVPAAAGDELRQVAVPDGQGYLATWPERALRLVPELTLPDWAEYEGAAVRKLGLSARAGAAYEELRSALEAAQGFRGPCRRFLGHPRQLQDDVLVEAASIAMPPEDATAERLEIEAEAWRLLLRIDPDEEAGSRWPAEDRVYFCVPVSRGARDLYSRAQAFTRAR